MADTLSSIGWRSGWLFASFFLWRCVKYFSVNFKLVINCVTFLLRTPSHWQYWLSCYLSWNNIGIKMWEMVVAETSKHIEKKVKSKLFVAWWNQNSWQLSVHWLSARLLESYITYTVPSLWTHEFLSQNTFFLSFWCGWANQRQIPTKFLSSCWTHNANLMMPRIET